MSEQQTPDTDTPETDANTWMAGDSWAEKDEVVDADFAREMERENIRLREALEKIERHGPIMGSTGDYRQGQLDILEAVSTIARLALCANDK